MGAACTTCDADEASELKRFQIFLTSQYGDDFNRAFREALVSSGKPYLTQSQFLQLAKKAEYSGDAQKVFVMLQNAGGNITAEKFNSLRIPQTSSASVSKGMTPNILQDFSSSKEGLKTESDKPLGKWDKRLHVAQASTPLEFTESESKGQRRPSVASVHGSPGQSRRPSVASVHSNTFPQPRRPSVSSVQGSPGQVARRPSVASPTRSTSPSPRRSANVSFYGDSKVVSRRPSVGSVESNLPNVQEEEFYKEIIINWDSGDKEKYSRERRPSVASVAERFLSTERRPSVTIIEQDSSLEGTAADAALQGTAAGAALSGKQPHLLDMLERPCIYMTRIQFDEHASPSSRRPSVTSLASQSRRPSAGSLELNNPSSPGAVEGSKSSNNHEKKSSRRPSVASVDSPRGAAPSPKGRQSRRPSVESRSSPRGRRT